MASDTVTATVDVQHVERQLLEAVSSPGFGPIASNALLAVRGLRAELARVTAERDATRRENYETALKLEQWETAHPWTGSDGDPIQDPHKVRRLWEASERDLLARAEKAEAARDSAERRMDAMRSECHAVFERIRAAGQPRGDT